MKYDIFIKVKIILERKEINDKNELIRMYSKILLDRSEKKSFAAENKRIRRGKPSIMF